MASGVQVAISMSNTGGAWDNAKKYIERATPDSELQGKGSDIHKVRRVCSFLYGNLVQARHDGRGHEVLHPYKVARVFLFFLSLV